MEDRCPACNEPIPEGFAEETCPHCGAALKPEADVFAAALAEASALRAPAPAAKPAPSRMDAAAAAPAPQPGVFKKPPRSYYERKTNVGQALLVASGVILVLVMGYFAWTEITRALARQRVDSVLARVKPEALRLEAQLVQARKMVKDRQFRQAGQLSKTIADAADLAMRNLSEVLDRVNEKLASPAAETRNQLGEIRRDAQAILDLPPVQLGDENMVEFQGKYVTPEERDRLFEEQMRAEGRELYEGEWLTEAEIHQKKGEILYGGKWYTKQEYDRLISSGELRPIMTPPEMAPKPETPAIGSSRFDASKTVWTIDDFETAAKDWSDVSGTWPNANPAAVALENRNGSSQLSITMRGGANDKSAIVRRIGLDFSSRKRITMDVYNATNEPIRIAIALETVEGATSRFYESRWMPLQADANPSVSFDLRTSDFKSAETQWVHAARVANLDNVAWLYVLVYFNKPGKLYLDNIQALSE